MERESFSKRLSMVHLAGYKIRYGFSAISISMSDDMGLVLLALALLAFSIYNKILYSTCISSVFMSSAGEGVCSVPGSALSAKTEK